MNGDLSDIASALTQSISVDGQSTITGVIKFTAGTAAAPGVTFISDSTTGIYYIGSKHIGVTVGGTLTVDINGNNIGSGQSGNVLQVEMPSGLATITPVGMVVDFAGTSAPSGWLLCFGQILTIANYPELANVISNTFGGDGVTTFGIPDYRGRIAAGKDNMGGSAANRIGTVVTDNGTITGTTLGSTGGSSTHAQITGEMPTHNHTITDPGHTHVQQANTCYNIAGANVSAGAGVTSSPNAGTATLSNVTGITINNAGSSTAMAWLQPTIMLNKIIFAGRP